MHFGNGGMRVPCLVAPGRISLAIGLARARQADGTNNPRPCKFCRDVRIVSSTSCDRNVARVVGVAQRRYEITRALFRDAYVYRWYSSARIASHGQGVGRIPYSGDGAFGGLVVPYSF